MTNSKGGQTNVYFKNLNAIRFIAASLVIICHIEAFKCSEGLENHWKNRVIYAMGNVGVTLFFVLSGFLISYLLYKEKEETKTISVRNFYIRRILRIWPLYFFIIFLGFFVFPFIGFLGHYKDQIWDHLLYKILLVIIFLPNLLLNLYGAMPYISQIWSIGVEEQFYLVWPALNKQFKSKWKVIAGVLFCYFFIRTIFYFLLPYNEITNTIRWYFKFTPIDCMAIGAIFALVIFENTTLTVFLRRIIFSKAAQIITLAIVAVSIFYGLYPPFANDYYSVLYGILICNFAANNNRLFSMENAVSNYLGKISYGLYMYHPIAIACCVKLLLYLNIFNNYLLYPLAFAAVILLSSLSYNLFEKRFIKLKVRYSDIVSGDNALVQQ